MAEYIQLSLDSSTNADLILQPVSVTSDPVLYFDIKKATGTFSLQPMEKISALIIPQSDPLTPSEASGFLADRTVESDPSRGMYIHRYTNEIGSVQTLSTLGRIPIYTTDWENIKFDLYWLQEWESFVIFDNYSGVYSYPHNIQPNEVGINAELIDDNTRVRYTIAFNEVNNASSVDYVMHDPYRLNITYVYGTGTPTGYFSGTPIPFTSSTDYTEFPAGSASGGIVFDLPFYDPRPTWNEVPANYMFRLNYHCANDSVAGSHPLLIPINHQEWADGVIRDFEKELVSSAKIENIRKIIGDDVFVENGTINRRRLSIGIEDISLRQNKYRKKGIYISNPYSSDYPIYTFSMKVNEYIPSYINVPPYEAVKYFVEFNSRPWIRISPINRSDETDSDDIVVPKMFVFDTNPENVSTSVKYLDYQAPIVVFRIKIVFDISRVTDDSVVPPEVRDYKCIIYDKRQLLEI